LKRLFCRTAAALLAAVLVFPVNARAITAEKAIVMDADTGYIFFEKRCNEKSLVASTTKILTALLICEQCNVLDQIVIPEEAVGIEGSSMYLQAGEVLSVQELLYGLMLSSGNDAAVALAIYCGDSVEGFARMMNDKAHQLGMKDSHFVNPHGLDAAEHYSTARDLAILASCAMQNPIFAKTVSTRSVTVGQRYLTNHNKLLWRVAGADGVKTGFTKAAGRILVSSAVRHGRRLVAVTIDDGNDWADHAWLYDQYFSEFQERSIVSQGDVLGSVEVLGGEQGIAELVAAADFSWALRPEEHVQIRLSAKGFAFAPVVRGGDAGVAYVCIGNKAVGRIPVVYAQTIEQDRD
jgi:D-alanyl-D-alanine carboxypeptidase